MFHPLEGMREMGLIEDCSVSLELVVILCNFSFRSVRFHFGSFVEWAADPDLTLDLQLLLDLNFCILVHVFLQSRLGQISRG